MSARYQCSVAAAVRQEPMVATASQVRGWLLVEVRGAWGSDAIHDSALGEHIPAHFKDGLRAGRIRAVCIRSHQRAAADGVRLFAGVAHRPGRRPTRLWRRDVGSLADVVDAVAGLAVDRRPDPEWERVDDPLVLVCTNGRHDQCCANAGRPLVRALRESPWADRVWECSHIGGDRFAANLAIVPHSLYFGRVEAPDAARLLDAFDAGRLDLTHFRGRTSFSLAEQAVEHFVRRELGVDGLDDVEIGPRGDDGSFPVRAGARRLHVRVGRRMVAVDEPLTCRGRPGQLVPEYSLVSLRPA